MILSSTATGLGALSRPAGISARPTVAPMQGLVGRLISRNSAPALGRLSRAFAAPAVEISTEPYAGTELEAVQGSLIGEVAWDRDLQNCVTLIGRTAGDFSIRHLPSGKSKAEGRLAVRINRNGDTDWHNLEIWDNLGDEVTRQIHKGTQIHITGRLRHREYTTKEGRKGVYNYITVDGVDRILGDNTQGSNQGAQAVWDGAADLAGPAALQQDAWAAPVQPGTGFAQPADASQAATPEEQWQALFNNFTDYYDNRVSKRNPRAPDFKHKKTGAPLWIDSRGTPAWVNEQLATLPTPPPPF